MRSKLKCPKCNQEFEYSWIPMVSFLSIRWGKKRYMRCPKCHSFSWFLIYGTQESKE
jgi:predicted nucleic-acid-binding Zn-ribbon protein